MQPNPESAPPDAERTEQAARIAAMLKRWQTEDLSQEPDWDVDALQPVRFAMQSEIDSAAHGS